MVLWENSSGVEDAIRVWWESRAVMISRPDLVVNKKKKLIVQMYPMVYKHTCKRKQDNSG